MLAVATPSPCILDRQRALIANSREMNRVSDSTSSASLAFAISQRRPSEPFNLASHSETPSETQRKLPSVASLSSSTASRHHRTSIPTVPRPGPSSAASSNPHPSPARVSSPAVPLSLPTASATRRPSLPAAAPRKKSPRALSSYSSTEVVLLKESLPTPSLSSLLFTATLSPTAIEELSTLGPPPDIALPLPPSHFYPSPLSPSTSTPAPEHREDNSVEDNIEIAMLKAPFHQRLSRTLSAEDTRAVLSPKQTVPPTSSSDNLKGFNPDYHPSFHAGSPDSSVTTIIALMERTRRNRDLIVHEPPLTEVSPRKRTGFTQALTQDIRDLREKFTHLKSKSTSSGALTRTSKDGIEAEVSMKVNSKERMCRSGDSSALRMRSKDPLAMEQIDLKQALESGHSLYHALGNPPVAMPTKVPSKANSSSLKKAKNEGRRMKGIP